MYSLRLRIKWKWQIHLFNWFSVSYKIWFLLKQTFFCPGLQKFLVYSSYNSLAIIARDRAGSVCEKKRDYLTTRRPVFLPLQKKREKEEEEREKRERERGEREREREREERERERRRESAAHTHTPTHTHHHTHTHTHTHTHAQHTHTHTHHTHTHTCWFLWFTGTFHRRNGFILYKLYVLLPYTYPTPKLSPHRRRCISTFPPKNAHCMIYKHFKLWGHWKCPHKSPSPCNTYVIPMSLYKFVSS